MMSPALRVEAHKVFLLQGDWHMPKLRQHLAQGGINFTNCKQEFGLAGLAAALPGLAAF